MSRRDCLCLATTALVWVHGAAAQAEGGAPPVAISPDVAVDLAGSAVLDEEVVADDGTGSPALLPLGALPDPADVDAYHRFEAGDQLFSLETGTDLGGGVVGSGGDVVRFDGSVYVIEFAASAEGIPDGVKIDAATVHGSGNLMLSFDITVDLGRGVIAADEDLVRFDGLAYTIFFDGSTEGVDEALDLDGAHYRASDGHLLLSFDGSGSLGGVNFDDEDILELDPAGPSWSLAFDGSAQHAALAAADVIAVPEPALPIQLLATSAFLLAIRAVCERTSIRRERS